MPWNERGARRCSGWPEKLTGAPRTPPGASSRASAISFVGVSPIRAMSRTFFRGSATTEGLAGQVGPVSVFLGDGGRSRYRETSMSHNILGLHHVTATVDDAQDDLDFCAGALGLRLVKRTVNFDNHNVYHFYYGDERGTPGTIWTTFPYKGHGVPVGKKGAGQISVTAFSVPLGSLEFWRLRLAKLGVAVTDAEERFGETAVLCADSSGLEFELVANRDDHRAAWTADGIGTDAAIRGLHSVTMIVRDTTATLNLMTSLLGYRVMNEERDRVRVGVNGGGPGKTIDIVRAPEASVAVNGLGTVHHVAMAIATAEEQLRLRDDLLHYGCRVTEVRDRCYFTSIYFREPGGVLFEVATSGPGFLIDEDLPDLGEGLKLPPWEEAQRRQIERGLAPIVVP